MIQASLQWQRGGKLVGHTWSADAGHMRVLRHARLGLGRARRAAQADLSGAQCSPHLRHQVPLATVFVRAVQDGNALSVQPPCTQLKLKWTVC